MENGPKLESVDELRNKLFILIVEHSQATNDAERDLIKERMRPIYDRFLPDSLWDEKAAVDPNFTDNSQYDELDGEWQAVVSVKKACASILQTKDGWNKK